MKYVFVSGEAVVRTLPDGAVLVQNRFLQVYDMINGFVVKN
jgi:hypothetical protein